LQFSNVTAIAGAIGIGRTAAQRWDRGSGCERDPALDGEALRTGLSRHSEKRKNVMAITATGCKPI
jgi:hypothetical protein